jgi:hypothetical protein
MGAPVARINLAGSAHMHLRQSRASKPPFDAAEIMSAGAPAATIGRRYEPGAGHDEGANLQVEHRRAARRDDRASDGAPLRRNVDPIIDRSLLSREERGSRIVSCIGDTTGADRYRTASYDRQRWGPMVQPREVDTASAVGLGRQ